MTLLMLSVPLLACALPGQVMSAEEQDCCLHMADQCDSSQMAELHSCCQKSLQLGTNTLQISNKYSPVMLDSGLHIALDVEPAFTRIVTSPSQLFITLPESPPGYTSILRI